MSDVKNPAKAFMLLFNILMSLSLILTLTKQKDGLNSVHIASIVGMSLLAVYYVCNIMMAISDKVSKSNKKTHNDQREYVSKTQKGLSSLLTFLGVAGGVTAFVCMCLNLRKMTNQVELDHIFAVASLTLVDLMLLIIGNCICFGCVVGCFLAVLNEVTNGVIFNNLGINSEEGQEEGVRGPSGNIIDTKPEEFGKSASVTYINGKGNSCYV